MKNYPFTSAPSLVDLHASLSYRLPRLLLVHAPSSRRTHHLCHQKSSTLRFCPSPNGKVYNDM